MTFVTVHVLLNLPLHNLNRDQSGQPKSQFDGGVQRARLSSQSLKRAARVAYLGSTENQSIRTRAALGLTLTEATRYAAETGLPFDEKQGRAAIKKVIDALAKKAKEDAETTPADIEDDAATSGDNILFFSLAELATLARAAVEKQQTGDALKRDDFIQDASSPSLDVAAFGRMFANATEIGTQAAIAVSHAATTHQMALTSDYFSAVEEHAQDHNGAGHIGMTYYTSGVYYRSFTIDVDQLRRSWRSFDADGSRDDLRLLVRALVRSLPTGRLSNSNPHTDPALVLAETQRCRVAYAFDEPVVTETGGYLKGSIKALAEQRALSRAFDPDNNPRAVVLGATFDNDFSGAEPAASLDDLVAFVVDAVYGSAA